MAKQEIKKNKGINKGWKNLEKGKWKPGQSGNPKGHPKGQRNFATIYREALKQLAKEKKTTPEKLEDLILKVGIAKAIGGDYRFWQDINDRLNGKPVQKNELTGADGKDLIPDNKSVQDADDILTRFINGTSKNSKK